MIYSLPKSFSYSPLTLTLSRKGRGEYKERTFGSCYKCGRGRPDVAFCNLVYGEQWSAFLPPQASTARKGALLAINCPSPGYACIVKKLSHRGLVQSEDRKNSLCGFCFFLQLFLTDALNPGLAAQAEQRLLWMQRLQAVLIPLRH
jgi:hypothetical protein